MTIAHKIAMTWSSPGSTSSVTGTSSASGDTEIVADLVAYAETTSQYDVSITRWPIKAAYLLSTVTDLHINTNDDGDPDDQIDLTAGDARVYVADKVGTTPFPNNDVARLYLHNGGAESILKLRILLNSLDD